MVVVFLQVNVDMVVIFVVLVVMEMLFVLLISQVGVVVFVVDLNVLVMNFIVDCWFEVIDVMGKKLFSGMQCKDGNLNLIGQVFYKFKIGVLVVVQIQY